MSARGQRRHAVYPHEERNGRNELIRTFEVWRHGEPVARGFLSRAPAQREADRLNAAEGLPVETRARKARD